MKSNPHNHTCHACTYTMLPPQGPRTGLTLDGPDKHGWHVLRLDGSPVADLDPHESAALAELLSQVATLDGWPDRSDMVHAVARTVNAADNEWANAPRTEPHEPWDIYVARAVLAAL